LSGLAARSTLRVVSHLSFPVTPLRWLVPALSLTLLLSWGSLYYAFAMWVQPLQVELRWSATSAMGAYSTALVVWGLCTVPVGRFIDRYGARWAMTLGSCLCGVLFVALGRTQSIWVFYLVWAGLGASMALTLYEPAFAAIVQAWPGAYRRRIGVLTLAGGLASTVFWPLTHVLVEALGWRATVLVYASVHLFICAPLHWFVLPASRPGSRPRPVVGKPGSVAPRSATRLAMRSPAFWLLAFSFAAFGFVTSAMATHVVPMIESTGVAPATAIAIAALIGPMQVAGRSSELLLAGRMSPLAIGVVTVALIPIALIALIALWAAPGAFVLLYAFAAIYGAGLGLLTIVRATTPVEIFGAGGYATISGALSGPSILARGAGPLAGTALIALHHSYDTVLLVLLISALGGAAAFSLAIRRETP
jgi:Major Facilitator Superfamily